MKETICCWSRCNEKITIDDSFENSTTGQNLGVVVSGWCKLHELAYSIQCDLFATLDKKKHHSDTANDLYKNNRKEFNRIQREALKLAKEKLE